jgi:hypothetical protein
MPILMGFSNDVKFLRESLGPLKSHRAFFAFTGKDIQKTVLCTFPYRFAKHIEKRHAEINFGGFLTFPQTAGIKNCALSITFPHGSR